MFNANCKNKLFIPCPCCDGGKSVYYYEKKLDVCKYCNGKKEVDIFFHFEKLGLNSDVNEVESVIDFVTGNRFEEYTYFKQKFDR